MSEMAMLRQLPLNPLRWINLPEWAISPLRKIALALQTLL
jgi:hypothetical protein